MKLRLLNEVDPKVKLGLKRLGYHDSAPHEVGLVGNKRTVGLKDKVDIKFNPNDESVQGEYMFHTHTTEDGEDPLKSLPSEQDLETAIQIFNDGLKGIVIRHGQMFTVVKPNDKSSRFSPAMYTRARKQGDMDMAINALKPYFDVEHGLIDEV